jgi:hypothetical protein
MQLGAGMLSARLAMREYPRAMPDGVKFLYLKGERYLWK